MHSTCQSYESVTRKFTASSAASAFSIGWLVPHSIIIPPEVPVTLTNCFSGASTLRNLYFGIWRMSSSDAPSCWQSDGAKDNYFKVQANKLNVWEK